MKNGQEKETALESLVARCADARKRYEGNEIDYYEYLFAVQEDERELWSGVYPTFETFIEKCVGRPNPAKWTRYVAARSELGLDKIREVGIPSAFSALAIANAKRRETYLEEQAEWSRQHNGVHASEQYAETARQNVDPKPERATPSINRLREVEKLRAENAELRRECGRLRRENDALTKQLEGLRAPKKNGGKSRSEMRGA